MATDFRGLKIKIDGDFTSLTSGLKASDKAISGVSRELKQVEKALKFNPGNTTLVTQQQQLLQQEVEETEQKLVKLKAAEEQIGKENMSTEQWNKLQREIVETESKLTNYKGKLAELDLEQQVNNSTLGKAADKLDAFGDKYGELGEKMESIGTTMTTAVTVPLMAVATASIAAFEAVDEGADNVIKATGATGEAAEIMKENYKNVAASIVGDFADIGGAVGEVNTRFGFVDEQLETTSIAFMKFSELTGVDAVNAVQKVSRYMGDAGLEADRYGEVLDQITVSAQVSGIAADKILENLTKYGAPMRALGFETQESIAIFSQWELVGVNTEIAFSGMKKAISNWSAQGKDAKVEFSKMLDEIAAAPTIAEATTKSIEVFGAKAGPDLADAIQGGRFEFQGMLDDIMASEGALDGTFDELIDGSYDAQLALQNAKLAAAEAGEKLMETLAPAIQKGTELIQDFTEWWKGLDDDQHQTILTLAGVAAAAGPVLVIGGKLIASTKGIATGLRTVQGAYLLSTNASLRQTVATKAATTAFAAQTPQTKKATQALKLYNVAQTAAKGAAVGLAIAGVAVLAKQFMNAHEKAKTFTKATDGLTDATKAAKFSIEASKDVYGELGEEISTVTLDIDGLIERQAELADTIAETNKQAETDAAVLETYRDTINRLGGQSDLTAEQQAELKLAIDGINEACGTTYEIIDLENGVISDQNGLLLENMDAINEVIDAKQRQILLEAHESNWRALAEAKIEAEEQHAEAIRQVEQAQRDYDNALETGIGIDHYKTQLDSATEAHKKTSEATKAANKAYNNEYEMMVLLQRASNETTGSLVEFTTSQASMLDIVKQNGESLNDFQTHLEMTGVCTEELANLTDEQLNKLAFNYDGSVTSITDTLAAFGIDAPILAEDAAKDIVKLSDDQIKRVAPLFGEAADGAIGQYNGALYKYDGLSGRWVAEKAKEEAESVDTEPSGENFTKGFARGMRSKAAMSQALVAARSMVSDALAEVRKAQGEKSPARIPMKSGVNFTKGFALGVKKETKAAEKEAATMISGTLDAAEKAMRPLPALNAAEVLGINELSALSPSLPKDVIASSQEIKVVSVADTTTLALLSDLQKNVTSIVPSLNGMGVYINEKQLVGAIVKSIDSTLQNRSKLVGGMS